MLYPKEYFPPGKLCYISFKNNNNLFSKISVLNVIKNIEAPTGQIPEYDFVCNVIMDKEILIFNVLLLNTVLRF